MQCVIDTARDGDKFYVADLDRIINEFRALNKKL